MLFEIGLDAIRAQHLPSNSPPWVALDEHGVSVAGDRAGYRETFVWTGTHLALVATTVEELLGRMNALGHTPELSPFGISQILNHGFPPVPHTVFHGVSRLASGDIAHLSADDGLITMNVTSVWPWRNSLSREDQVSSTERLRSLIGTALNRQLAASDGRTALMLSSGKDSVALAVALAAEGHNDGSCFTFKAGPKDQEHVYAAELCRRLDLTHHTFGMPANPTMTQRALVHFFERSPFPTADQAAIPYVIITEETEGSFGSIIDGGGNDGYMGFLPSRATRIKHTFRVRHRASADIVKSRIAHDSPLNYLTRTRAATALPNRMFRNRETQRFYPEAVDTEAYWQGQSASLNHLDTLDFIAATRIRHTEPSRVHPKVFMSARAHDMAPILPYCDEDLADYCFNLPETSRFDRSTRTNKLLLRQLLEESVGYDPTKVGTNHFQFDGASFLLDHRSFVRDEILSCQLWSSDLQAILDDWLQALPQRPYLYHSLLALFMISGWHNHSMYAPAASVRT